MNATKEFASGFARASLRKDDAGIAQVVARGVYVRADELQRWVLACCEEIQARGVVLDMRRAIVAIDWAAYAVDPCAQPSDERLLPVAMIMNPALLHDLRDWARIRGRQGYMRAIFSDGESATTWAADRGWVGSL